MQHKSSVLPPLVSYRSGFTLVEMLVVVTIISLLTGVIVLSVYNATRNANIAAASAELAELEKAFVAYSTTYAYLPPAGVDVCSLCGYRGQSSFSPSDWALVSDALYNEGYITERLERDPWGNYYAYDDNYRNPAWASSYGGVPVPTILCSVGPNGELETYVDGSQHPGSEAQGDDICIFIPDND